MGGLRARLAARATVFEVRSMSSQVEECLDRREGTCTVSTSLRELLRAHQRARWRENDLVPVESFLEQHPALLADPDAILDLIGNEVELRRDLGETPSLESYIRRFPHLETGLRLLFETFQTQAVAPDTHTHCP